MALVLGGGKAGGSQAFVDVTIQHSADFSNLTGNAPVLTALVTRGSITLPATAFGNNGHVSVVAGNAAAFAVKVAGILLVQNADGTVWLERDTSGTQTIPAADVATVDFDASGGGAGAGLSWNATSKQVDIASAGVFSAVVSLYAQTL